MKKVSAILLGMFALLISLESSVAMHFCHETLVETSVNRELSGCCNHTSESQQPILKKKCCEIAQFTVDIGDTTVTHTDISITKSIVFNPIIQFEVNVLYAISPQHILWVEPPPNPYRIPLQILFEQYLI